MKRVVLMLLVSLLPAFALAGGITAPERESLLQHLDRTSRLFLESVEGLSEAQWNYRAAEGKWTIAEVAEHIAASESFICAAVEGSLKEPAATELLKDARKDDTVLKFIVDRSRKFTAPEPLQPQNRFGSPDAAVASFRAERAKTVALARESGDLRAYATQHPGFGPLDAYGWLLFLSGHSERHTLQIQEVKSHEGFPK